MSLTIAQDNNIGSLGAVSLLPAYAFTSLNPVTFAAGYTAWVDIDFLEENAQLTDESAETDNGMQYTYNLIFAFNKKRANLLASLQPYLGTIAIAKVTDLNGFTQIIGTLQSPITLKQNNDSGKAFADMNNVLITGLAVQDIPAIVPPQ